MRPVDFEYTAPTTVQEAVQALVDGDDDTTLLGGGQSLMPVLRLRMAAPSTVIDLGRVPELRQVREDGDDLVIGAMTTHHTVARDPLVLEHAGVLAQAAGSIGDPQIRYRGTVGGSLAHADPAGDIAPAVLALEGSMELTGPSGTRTVPAREFLRDQFTTALAEDEVLTAVRVPKHTGWGMHYERFSQVAQSWAIVAVAAAVRVDAGALAEVRLGMSNMGSTALRAGVAEGALTGQPLEAATLQELAARAGEGTTPTTDPAGTPDYRRHLAGVLAGRAVLAAAGVTG
ncbi:FAD binding domain-containing protein [Janibacter sp. GS2]|uniref:FAD binding domain-containing protein n=1 Tax=Janibacter sp. GS2 TaxID=3442646 RepID=UPI003EB97EAB